MQKLSKGTLLPKLDLKKAYCTMSVHPDDHTLLGIRWGTDVYIDTALLLAFAWPLTIIQQLTMCWAAGMGFTLQGCSITLIFFLGPPSEPVCAQALRIALGICQELGVPVAVNKMEGPLLQPTFLGINIDSCTNELSLLSPKLG